MGLSFRSSQALKMSAGVAGLQEKLNKSLNQKGMIGDTFKMLEDNTGVQRLYIAYGLGGIIVLWLAFGFGAQLLANIVGFVYPRVLLDQGAGEHGEERRHAVAHLLGGLRGLLRGRVLRRLHRRLGAFLLALQMPLPCLVHGSHRGQRR